MSRHFWWNRTSWVVILLRSMFPFNTFHFVTDVKTCEMATSVSVVLTRKTDLFCKWSHPFKECRFLFWRCFDYKNCAILVICWGPHGISDVPCENTQRTQDYSPCLCLYRALYAVFVIPTDGNRQRLEFHRHRKGFVGSQGTELSLNVKESGNLHSYKL